MDNKKLIEKIMTQVKDEELRDNLLKAIADDDKPGSRESGINFLATIGLKPDAAVKTVRFQQTMNKAGCAFFALLGLAMIEWFEPVFGTIFVVMSIVIFLLNKKFYGNLSD